MRRAAALVALGTLLAGLVAGCRPGSAGGDTVPTPPRDLVEKSFKPPAGKGAPQPGPVAPR